MIRFVRALVVGEFEAHAWLGVAVLGGAVCWLMAGSTGFLVFWIVSGLRIGLDWGLRS